jgi:glucose-6-phosphate isomerase
MLPKINPTTTKAWAALQAHAAEMKQASIRQLFNDDADRFK